MENQESNNLVLTGGLVTWADNDIGVYFDVITDHSITITNNITDNYLENNTAIHDTIAHSPIECSLNGMIGELVYIPSTSNPKFLKRVYDELNAKIDLKKIGVDKIKGKYRDYVTTDKLSVIGQLIPPVDNLTQLAKNAAVYIEDSINRYQKIYKNFKRKLTGKTHLQEIYEILFDLRESNTKLIFTSPFGVLYDMYITNIQFNQGNENHVANISISMKQLKFTDIAYTKADVNVLSKYDGYMKAQIENCGNADGAMSNDSSLYNWFGKPFNLEYATWNDINQ